MELLEYDEVDPLQVLNLTLLELGIPLTPEHAAHIRRTDPRPFPCLTVNAVESGVVLGQAGIFRLPMIFHGGQELVGGVWATAIHPQHTGRGIASALLDAAHQRMRDAGLRFSTLRARRSGIAYRLYQRHGYADMNVWATALAHWETAHQPTRLRAQRLGAEGFALVEQIFRDTARGYLGFAWRHSPFDRLQHKVRRDDIWIMWENDTPVGYLFARLEGSLLQVSVQLLHQDIDAAEAIAAIAAQVQSSYAQVTLTRPVDIASFRHAGWQMAHFSCDAFMIKPLLPDVTVDDARRLFAMGTDRFLISWLDTTFAG